MKSFLIPIYTLPIPFFFFPNVEPMLHMCDAVGYIQYLLTQLPTPHAGNPAFATKQISLSSLRRHQTPKGPGTPSMQIDNSQSQNVEMVCLG